MDIKETDAEAEVANVTSSSANVSTCISTFDMTRMDNVTPFSVSFVFQGKSWYTKWLTGEWFDFQLSFSYLTTFSFHFKK